MTEQNGVDARHVEQELRQLFLVTGSRPMRGLCVGACGGWFHWQVA